MKAFEPFVTKSAPQILALADRRKSRSFFGFAFVAFWCGMLSCIKAIDMMAPVYSSTLPSMTLSKMASMSSSGACVPMQFGVNTAASRILYGTAAGLVSGIVYGIACCVLVPLVRSVQLPINL